jgi:beta-glucosidase
MANLDIEAALKKLTLQEKVTLLSGIDFWHTKAYPQHGIPSIRVSDGPNGVRGTRFFNGFRAACFPCGTGLAATWNAALLQEAGSLMAAEARHKGAHAILGPTVNLARSPLGGRGFESFGEDPVLGGLCAAAVIKGIQAGDGKNGGILAVLKHFVCNDQEHERNAVNAIVTQRALRELYVLPFQIAVRDAQPAAIMTGYNAVNGKWCSEDKSLLEDMLRKNWKWDGLVMSDWWGTYSTTEAVLAGLDLEMPGPSQFRGDILRFNASTGKIPKHVLDDRVRNVLKFVKRSMQSGVPESAHEGEEGNTPETAALLRKIAGESIVLLKNEKKTLPLAKDKKTVVIGPNAKTAMYHGGGSASLAAYYAVAPYDGISAKLASKPDFAIGAYSHKMLPYLSFELKTPDGKPGLVMHAYNEAPGKDNVKRQSVDEVILTKSEVHLVDYYNKALTSNPWYADFEGLLTADEDCEWEFGLVVVGTAQLFVNGELVVDNATKQVLGTAFYGMATVEETGRYKVKKGETYNIKVEFGSAATSKIHTSGSQLGGGSLRIGGAKVIDPKAEIARAAALAKTADQVIICAGLNADWESESYDRDNMDLPSPMDELIRTVASANANTVVVMQSGTPVTMPWVNEVAGIVHAWYGGNETGNAIADVLFGDVNPSGKLSLTFPKKVQDNPAFLNFRAEGGRTLYGEDVYIGYRYYEFAEKEVLFPFGHGLSYSSFKFENATVKESEGKLSVSVDVQNVGEIKGAEVVQVYVAPKQKAAINRPHKELKGFAKVELGAGEKKNVDVEIETKYAASYWDEEASKWCVEKGEYEVVVSDSSAVSDTKALNGTFVVEETFWWDTI